MNALVAEEAATGNPSEDLHESEESSEYEAHDDLSGVRLDPALMLHAVLKETYQNLGYELISVPPMPVARRSKFVIERIENMITTTEMIESK